MLYCRFCGASLPDEARFCHLCGKEVDRTPRCRQCGAVLPEGSRFCSFCGAPLQGTAAPAPQSAPMQNNMPMQNTPMQNMPMQSTPAYQSAPAQAASVQSAPPQQSAHHQGRPPEIRMGSGRTITIPAPTPAPQQEYRPVAPPATAPLSGISVPAIANPHPFTGSVQRFFGAGGAHYTFSGTGMYGFLEPFSMNYTDGQGPLSKNGGQWFFHPTAGAEGQEVPALSGAQILTSAPEGMYAYIAPTIYFISSDGAMRPFTEAAETLTDMVCYQNWLFVTYLGPFEDHIEQNGSTVYCDRSYVVVYDRASGDAAAILERCAGVYYIDSNIIILCDLLDSGEISRNVYKIPIHGWTETGLKTLANYTGRIRGSMPFAKLLFDSCGANNHWKNPTDCTADLRCCDWKDKMLGYQKKGALVWRAFSGAPATMEKSL